MNPYFKTIPTLFTSMLLLLIPNCQSNFQSISNAMDNPTAFQKELLEISDIDMKDEFGRSLLMIAASQNRKEIVSMLLDKKIDVRSTDLSNRSALDYAVYDNSLESFILILDRSPNLMKDTMYLENVLMNAIELNKVEFVRFLLHKRFPINHILTNTNRTILNSALEFAHQNKDVIHLLIQNGADTNAIEADGKPPLFRLKQDADLLCLKSLIEGKANLNFKDNENHTVLFYWAQTKRFSFIKEALRKGAIPESGMYILNITNRSYETNKTKVDYQHSESLKYVPSEYGGIVRTKVKTTGTVQDEEKIPIMEYAEKHDKDLYLLLKKVGYK